MAAPTLQFGFSELADSTGFILVEQTGAYSASNTGGWGGSNTAWSTAFYAEISIYDINGNSIGIVDTEFPFTSFDSSPTDTVWPFPKLLVNASSYSLTTFADATYRIVYTARLTQGGTIIASVERYVWFDSEIRTNLKNVLLTSPGCGCDSGSAYKWTVYQANDIAGFFLVESGNYTTAQDMNERLVQDTSNFCVSCGC